MVDIGAKESVSSPMNSVHVENLQFAATDFSIDKNAFSFGNAGTKILVSTFNVDAFKSLFMSFARGFYSIAVNEVGTTRVFHFDVTNPPPAAYLKEYADCVGKI